MNKGQFLIIPWECDTMAALAEMLLGAQSTPEKQQEDLSNHLLVFPHRRPRSYLLRALMADPRLPRPCRPPEVVSAGLLFSKLRIDLELPGLLGDTPPPLAGEPGRIVGRLDRVGVLQQCVSELAAESKTWGGPLSRLPMDDPTLFTPWGLRLQSLLEEFYRWDIDPENMLYPEQQPHPFAAALLQQLGDVATRYGQRMREKGWTTPGHDARLVARHAAEACTILEGRNILLVGFSQMDEVEEQLFHALWRQGATMIVQGDKKLAFGETPHWSCASIQALARRWGAQPELLCTPATDRDSDGPQIEFHEGFDLHSQLDALQRSLAALPAPVGHEQTGELPGETAVVLPETGLLLPVLHHVPRKDRVNISMGYPLARSPLARLLECLLQLQENAPAPDAYYWKDVVALLRHPYLKMLATKTPEAEEQTPEEQKGDTLHRAFQACEKVMRTGTPTVRPQEWEPQEIDGGWRDLVRQGSPEALHTLFSRVMDVCLNAWVHVECLDDAARALEGLCTLLVEHGGDLWERFPIDAECLHRLLYSVIPAMRQCAIAPTKLPKEAIFAILRDELADERVPFDSSPTVAPEGERDLQILGLLETRCISFDTVFVLDATDDLLPGRPASDPLLPDTLRRMAGLPDSRHREEMVAHAFFRLLHSARHATLLYQNVMEGGSLWDDKRLRSRFLEELLWRKEQELGHVLTPGEPPVHAVSYPIHAPGMERRAITKGETAGRRLETILHEGLTPSALDQYLLCPAKFFYARIAQLKPMDVVEEDGDPKDIGDLIHHVLEDFFRPLTGSVLHQGAVDPQALRDTYLAKLRESEFYPRIPQDQRLMLERTGVVLLTRYLENMPQTTILEVETFLRGAIESDGRTVMLKGKADRIDSRVEAENGEIVLDYKTGKPRLPQKGLWQDEDLFARLRCWPDCEHPAALLPELAERVRSVQLPCYCQMRRQQSGKTPWDAGVVPLADGGKEAMLFGPKPSATERADVIETRIPVILEFLLRHMLQSEGFAPIEGGACNYCDFAGPCRGGSTPVE